MGTKKKAGAGEILGGAGQGAAIGTKILPGWGTAIGAVVGGIGSAIFGGEDYTPEELARQAALKKFNALPDIDWAATLPKLTQYQKQEIEDAILENDRDKLVSAMESIPEEDGQLREAKMSALGQLQRQGAEGLTLSDVADIKSIQADQAQQARRAKDTVMQSMDQRGMASSGANVAAQIAAEQTGANRAGQEQLAIAAQRQQAKRDALLKSGDLASKYSDTDFSRNKDVASAKDVFANFNEQQASNRAMRNATAQRDTQDARALERIKQEQSRVNIQNEMSKNRAALEKAKYDHEVGKLDKQLTLETGVNTAAKIGADESAKGLANTWKGINDVVDSDVGKSIGGLFKSSDADKAKVAASKNPDYASIKELKT